MERIEELINEYNYMNAFIDYNSKMHGEQLALRLKLKTARIWHIIILLILLLIACISVMIIGG